MHNLRFYLSQLMPLRFTSVYGLADGSTQACRWWQWRGRILHSTRWAV